MPADYRRILTLVVQGRSYTDMTTTVGCSCRDMAKVRRLVAGHDLTTADDITDDQLAAWFPDRRRGLTPVWWTP